MNLPKNNNANVLAGLFGGLEEAEENSAEANHDAALARLMEALPYSLELHTPAPDLKFKLLSAVREYEATSNRVPQKFGAETGSSMPVPAQLWKKWSSNPAATDLLVQRSAEGEWEKTGVDGVEVKQLFVDDKRGYVTMLVRMQPGSSYPSHRHAGFEECLVLHGDLSVGETTLRAGDYQRAAGGSVHVIQSTKAGCSLFIVSSQHDELLA
ncbi:MAG: cupin domain-containing protein [candidate division KSB1 bacterium]